MSCVDAIRNTAEAESLNKIYKEMQQAITTMWTNHTKEFIPEFNKQSSIGKSKVNITLLDMKIQEEKLHHNDLERKIKDLQNEIALDTERIKAEQEKVIKAKIETQFSKAITGTKILCHEGQYVAYMLNSKTKKTMCCEYDQDGADLSSKMWENMKRLCID